MIRMQGWLLRALNLAECPRRKFVYVALDLRAWLKLAGRNLDSWNLKAQWLSDRQDMARLS